MGTPRVWSVLLMFIAASVCLADEPNTLAPGDYDKAEMAAAIKKAQGSVDRFLKEMEAGKGMRFAVKAPIQHLEDEEKVEHFWLIDVTYKDGVFEGTIDNKPEIVEHVALGQKWKIAREEISDWMFLRDGKMHGNYTVRPLLKSMNPREAQFIRSILAEP